MVRSERTTVQRNLQRLQSHRSHSAHQAGASERLLPGLPDHRMRAGRHSNSVRNQHIPNLVLLGLLVLA